MQVLIPIRAPALHLLFSKMCMRVQLSSVLARTKAVLLCDQLRALGRIKQTLAEHHIDTKKKTRLPSQHDAVWAAAHNSTSSFPL